MLVKKNQNGKNSADPTEAAHLDLHRLQICLCWFTKLKGLRKVFKIKNKSTCLCRIFLE